MANHFDTDNRDFLMGRDCMTDIEIEVAALDRAIAHLKLLRDAVACQSLPIDEFGIRKKQYHWVAGEAASSKVYESGIEDCGK
jgi:hypothetical protein